MNIVPRILLAVAMSAGLIGLGVGTFKFLTNNPREPEVARDAEILPAVKTIIARPETLSLPIASQGIVLAEQSTTLAAQVGGRIIQVSPELKAGLAVKAGEILLQIEAGDYEAALSAAEAQLAEAEAGLATEEARAAQALRDWERLGTSGEASPLTLREPFLASARASVLAAEAAAKKARLDLERTRISAPFDARVTERLVDLGSTVSTGMPVAELYSTTSFEVRLPVSLDDLPFVAGEGDPKGATVTLSTVAGGVTHSWEATIVRSEAEIDRQSRSAYLVASLPPEDLPGSILRPGLFVYATIEGRPIENVFRVPRSAFAGLDTVLVIDAEDRLRVREVAIVREAGEDVLVSSGIEVGERLCLTLLPAPVEGMKVAVIPLNDGLDTSDPTAPVSSATQL